MMKLDNKTRQLATCDLLLKASSLKIAQKDRFYNLHRETVKHFKVSMLTNDELTRSYHKLVKSGKLDKNKILEEFIRLKRVRSLSGIVVVSVLTKPYDCPGNCLYCPTQKGIPKSYMKNEPAVMRAILNNFDPYKQTQNRLLALEATGHSLDKINIRVIGGTWSYYPKAYQTWFIKRCFKSANDFASNLQNKGNSLLNQQIINETAKCRIVEISIETRQDYIDVKEIKRLRMLGVTKVELGAQSIYNDVLRLNRRGHDVSKTIEATKMLRDAGFKVAYQIMLNLPGSDVSRDETMLKELFSNPDFRPDYIKIYPLAIVKDAPVYQLYMEGKIKPYSKDQLMKLIGEFKKNVPYYLRIERIIRDIPSDDIVEGGAKISNLRQLIKDKMDTGDQTCQCIRCREVGDEFDQNLKMKLWREDYDSSGGKEIFLSFESENRDKLYSILRLRIPSYYLSGKRHFLTEISGAALIREIHTYGPVTRISGNDKLSAQHRGYGKKMMIEAEKIVRNEYKIENIAVIAGVGAREYFRKLGYRLDSTYMLKKLIK